MARFERCVLINLERRQDRLGAMKAKLSDIPDLDNWQRFRAIDGNHVGVPPFFTSGGGAYGCRASHTTILQEAMMDGVEELCVLEDDACFPRDFSARLAEFMTVAPSDWELLMLGGQDINNSSAPTGIDGVRRCHNTQRTHCYVIRGHQAMQSLYKLWMRADRHIDHLFGYFQQQRPSYQPEPFLVGQDEGPSDISGRKDTIRFWSAPGGGQGGRPLVLLNADRQVYEALRNLGLHGGYWRDPKTGIDCGLTEIATTNWTSEKLQAWAQCIVSEAADRDLIPCLWYNPLPSEKFLKDRLAIAVQAVTARTIADAAGELPLIRSALRGQQTLWIWKGEDRDILEGLAYHGFHRGWSIDEVTGLEQGLRKAVLTNNYRSIKSLVRLLSKEAATLLFGKVLLAHPQLDIERVENEFPGQAIIELRGADLPDLLAQFHEVIYGTEDRGDSARRVPCGLHE